MVYHSFAWSKNYGRCIMKSLSTVVIAFAICVGLLTAGDGKANLSVRRLTDNVGHLLRATAGYTAMQWGEAGDKMAPADYDGDGKTDMAVFRPSNSNWYIIQSTNGILIQQFGVTGDVPTQSSFSN